MFLELPQNLDRRVLQRVMCEAEKALAALERQESPRESGLLREALGGSKLHVYGDGRVMFATVGVRRGFRKEVQPTQRGGVKRVGKKLAPNQESAGGGAIRDPVRYLHLVTRGRGALDSVKGRVFHSVNGRFFTRTKAAAANPFMIAPLRPRRGSPSACCPRSATAPSARPPALLKPKPDLFTHSPPKGDVTMSTTTRLFNGSTFNFAGTPVLRLAGMSYKQGGNWIDVTQPTDVTKIFEIGQPDLAVSLKFKGHNGLTERGKAPPRSPGPTAPT